MLPIDKACARVQFIGRIHGPMHAQRAYTRTTCIHAPTPAILGISLSTPDITQLPRHLCHRGESGVRTDILPRSVETSTLDSLADTTR